MKTEKNVNINQTFGLKKKIIFFGGWGMGGVTVGCHAMLAPRQQVPRSLTLCNSVTTRNFFFPKGMKRLGLKAQKYPPKSKALQRS